MSSETISIIAVLIAGLSALYARWAATEARKANELNRLKSLQDLKHGYLKEMDHQIRISKDWGKGDSFTQACRDKFEDIDKKYREVCKELDVYHSRIVNNKI